MMTRIEVDRIKEEYPPGSHVKLIKMKGEPQKQARQDDLSR